MSDQPTYPIAAGERIPGGRKPSETRAIDANEFRPPRRGEWYLSGAIVEAYRAQSNLTTPFRIARLVEARSTVTWHVIDKKEDRGRAG